ncbi:hypothetical protein CZ794_12680 [Psychrobacter sp. JB385]|nr:hypothetical protein CZ794_12680 [Psychrobacter sp. JB385]
MFYPPLNIFTDFKLGLTQVNMQKLFDTNTVLLRHANILTAIG